MLCKREGSKYKLQLPTANFIDLVTLNGRMNKKDLTVPYAQKNTL